MKSFVGGVAGCLAHCWVLEQQRELLGLVFPGHGWLMAWIRFGGLVVGRCVVGLLFENYIVNASIFIKKQFL